MILVRHGLMVVGMPYSAKTCSYRVLAGALTLMAEGGDPEQMKVLTPVLNPKSVAIGRLYGEFDEVPHAWTRTLTLTSALIRTLTLTLILTLTRTLILTLTRTRTRTLTRARSHAPSWRTRRGRRRRGRRRRCS